jgi:hypothetical protein
MDGWRRRRLSTLDRQLDVWFTFKDEETGTILQEGDEMG